jgi:peptide chain release factor 1
MQYRPKLDEMERRYEELTAQMADASVIGDSAQYRKVTKEQSELSDIVTKYREWKTVNENLQQARAMQNDAELAEMAQDEILHLQPRLDQIEQALTIALLPKDPNDDKNIVLEIRAGTG